MAKVASPLINWILRAFQALFGLVTLGLAATLIRDHHRGSLPSSLGFTAFVGGITILAALIGIAAVWLEFLDGIIGLAVDGLVAVLNIAGGIVSDRRHLWHQMHSVINYCISVPCHQAERRVL